MAALPKKAMYEMRYPKGTVIELTEPIEDPYSPKKAGDRFRVDFVDDQLQLHGSWLAPAKGSIAVIIGKDKFKAIG